MSSSCTILGGGQWIGVENYYYYYYYYCYYYYFRKY